MTTSVRELRRLLASALSELGRNEEALEQLDLAVQETGPVKERRELYVAMGRLQETQGDARRALSAYLNGVAVDVTDQTAAQEALRVLGEMPERRWPTGEGARLADSLNSEPAFARPAALLVGRLLRHDDDPAGAVDALRKSVSGPLPGRAIVLGEIVDFLLELGLKDEARATIADHPTDDLRAAESAVLLEEGQFESALATAEQSGAVAVKIIALTALRRASEAVNAPLPLVVTPDVEVARIVAQLSLQDYQAAKELGEQVARAVGTDPATVLLRSQILLEGAGAEDSSPNFSDVDEARRSFERLQQTNPAGNGEFARKVLSHRWFRQQLRARAGDSRFQYASAEAVVAFDPDLARRREAIAGCELLTTTEVQRAALLELQAQLMSPADGPVQAAAAYRKATDAVIDAGDPVRAIPLVRKATDLDSSVENKCALADVIWQASYTESISRKVRVGWLDDAIKRLNAPEGDFRPDHGDRPAFMHGLLTARQYELEAANTSAATPLAWEATPYALAAAIASDFAYYYAVAAWALHLTRSTACAYTCAKRAFELDRWEPWYKETYYVMLVNHLGDYNSLQAALDPGPDDDVPASELVRGLVLYTSLATGMEAKSRQLLEEEADQEPYRMTWARWTSLQARGLLMGWETVAAEMQTMAAELIETGEDTDIQAEIYRSLGQLDHSDQAIDRAEDRDMPGWQAMRHRSLNGLARETTRGTAEELLAAQCAGELSPSRLRVIVNVDLPTVLQISPPAKPSIDRLSKLCQVRLAQLLAEPPPLVEDFKAHGQQLAATGIFASRLLWILELEQQSRFVELAEPIVELADFHPKGALAPALTKLRDRLAQRSAEALADRLEQDGLTAADAVELLARVEKLRSSVDGATLARARIAAWSLNRDQPLADELANSMMSDLDPTDLALALGGGIVRMAASGQDALAVDTFALSARLLGAESELAARLSQAVLSIPELTAVDQILKQIMDDKDTGDIAGACAEAARSRLLERLNLLWRPTESDELPMTTPIIVELADDLVPFVDPALDGGVFIDQLIPQSKQRVAATTGMNLPGIRLRPASAHEPGVFAVQIEEVEMARGFVRTGTMFSVRPAAPDQQTSLDGYLTRFHPATGARGVWSVEPDEDTAASADDADTLSTAEYLMYALELAIRQHLSKFMGPQDAANLVSQWSAEDGGELVLEVLPDQSAQLRLTWILQFVLDDGLSVGNWREICGAISSAGGIDSPLPQLCEAVRARLRRPILPTAEDHVVRVPTEFESGLLDDSGTPPAIEHEFLTWLRQTIPASGVGFTLATSTEQARLLVDRLAKSERSLVETIQESDLVS